jgi:hypothetical protein
MGKTCAKKSKWIADSENTATLEPDCEDHPLWGATTRKAWLYLSVKNPLESGVTSIMKIQLLVLLLILPGSGAAQRRAWQTQFPCDRTFGVEVPSRLYEVSWFEGKHGPSLEPDESFEKDGRAFVALQRTPKKRQFGVVVQRVPREERRPLARGEFGGLYFLIGGDDATPTSEKTVHVNGLTGREYVYAKEISEDTYTRGRIFYAAGHLYIIVFVGTSAEDLSSQEADRFLNSFRLRG